MADHLTEYMQNLRTDPMFREFLKRMPRPDVPVFKPGNGSQEVRDDWVYKSGQRRYYDQFYEFLAGGPEDAAE